MQSSSRRQSDGRRGGHDGRGRSGRSNIVTNTWTKSRDNHYSSNRGREISSNKGKGSSGGRGEFFHI